jgi:HEPN domain-containing protein
MSGTTDPRAWAARAEEDYLLAQSALRRKKPLTSGACFHAQQCAEKYLKALLVRAGQPFPRVHDLLALQDLCMQNGVLVSVEPDQLDLLSSYAVRVRYPGEDATADEARQALVIARSVRRFARRYLGLTESARS